MSETRASEGTAEADRELRAEIEELESELRDARTRETSGHDVLRDEVSALVRRRDIVAAHVAGLERRRDDLQAELRLSKEAIRFLRRERWQKRWRRWQTPILFTLILGLIAYAMVQAGLLPHFAPRPDRTPMVFVVDHSLRATGYLNQKKVDVMLGDSELRTLRVSQIDVYTDANVLIESFHPVRDGFLTFELPTPLGPGNYFAVIRLADYPTPFRTPVAHLE